MDNPDDASIRLAARIATPAASAPGQAPPASASPKPVRQLTRLAVVARSRLRENLATRARPGQPPQEAVTQENGRRAEAALLISAILEFRPDLRGELGIPAAASPAAFIEPDLLAEIDRIAADRMGASGNKARAAVLNAIVRDWLAARPPASVAAAS